MTSVFQFQRRTSGLSEKKKRLASSRWINRRSERNFIRILCLRTLGATATLNKYVFTYIFCHNKTQSDPSRARLDQKVKHRNRLFHRVGQQEHQQHLQQQNNQHHQQQHPHQQHHHQQQHHFPPNQRPPHPKSLNNHQSAKKQSPQKVPPSTSSPSQLPTPTSRPSVTPTQPPKAAQSPPEASRSNLTSQEVTPPPQLQRSAISQPSQLPPVAVSPPEEPKNTSEAAAEAMPQVQSQQQPTSASNSPKHPKSGTRQQPVSPFRPQHPNFHSSTPPSLRPPILR